MTVAPSRAQPLALLVQRLRVDAERGEKVRIAEHDGLAVDLADRALAGRRVEFLDLAQLEVALLRRPHDRVGQRMLAGALDAGGEPQDLGLLEISAAATIATTFGLPSVSVPVLSTTSVSTFSMRSSASAFLIRTPACAPRPTPTMIDIGVASPSAHGQAMISTLTAATRPKAKRGSGPKPGPGGEGEQRDGDHRRHEPAGDLVGEPLDRRARALRLRHHLHDLRQQRVAADLVGAHHEAAGLVERAGDDLGAGLLGDRHRFAGHQRFVERGAAFEDDAVDRHLFAGPHAQAVADREAVDRDLLVGAVLADTPRGLRRELEQRPDRARGCSRARSSSTWPSSTSTVMTAAASK